MKIALIAALILMAHALDAPAQGLQPPMGTQLYGTSPQGHPLLWRLRVRMELDSTGDGQSDIIEAWNVDEILGADATAPRPDVSGIWMTPSEDIIAPDGTVAQEAGERQGPYPIGTVGSLSPTPDGIEATIDDGTGSVPHVLAWPGTPESMLPTTDPSEEIGVVDSAILSPRYPCAWPCDYYRREWSINLASSLHASVIQIQLRLTDPEDDSLDRILTNGIGDPGVTDQWYCNASNSTCTMQSSFCEGRASDPVGDPNRGKYLYTIHVYTEYGLFSTVEPAQARLSCG